VLIQEGKLSIHVFVCLILSLYQAYLIWCERRYICLCCIVYLFILYKKKFNLTLKIYCYILRIFILCITFVRIYAHCLYTKYATSPAKRENIYILPFHCMSAFHIIVLFIVNFLHYMWEMCMFCVPSVHERRLGQFSTETGWDRTSLCRCFGLPHSL